MGQVFQLAKGKLDKQISVLPCVERVLLGQEFKEKKWEMGGIKELAIRDFPLTDTEGERLGGKYTAKIARMREIVMGIALRDKATRQTPPGPRGQLERVPVDWGRPMPMSSTTFNSSGWTVAVSGDEIIQEKIDRAIASLLSESQSDVVWSKTTDVQQSRADDYSRLKYALQF